MIQWIGWWNHPRMGVWVSFTCWKFWETPRPCSKQMPRRLAAIEVANLSTVRCQRLTAELKSLAARNAKKQVINRNRIIASHHLQHEYHSIQTPLQVTNIKPYNHRHIDIVADLIASMSKFLVTKKCGTIKINNDEIIATFTTDSRVSTMFVRFIACNMYQGVNSLYSWHLAFVSTIWRLYRSGEQTAQWALWYREGGGGWVYTHRSRRVMLENDQQLGCPCLYYITCQLHCSPPSSPSTKIKRRIQTVNWTNENIQLLWIVLNLNSFLVSDIERGLVEHLSFYISFMIMLNAIKHRFLSLMTIKI